MYQDNMLNSFTPNDPYRGRTAPLTSKVAFYVFIQQIQVLNILNMWCWRRMEKISWTDHVRNDGSVTQSQ